jgi:hypothetical protein
VFVDENGVVAAIELSDRPHRSIVRMFARGRCPA